MNKLGFCVGVATLFSISCTDDPAGPQQVDIRGEYNLARVNGQPLPYELTGSRINGGTAFLSIEADTLRFIVHDQKSTLPPFDPGDYTFVAASFMVLDQHQSGDSTVIGLWYRDTNTLQLRQASSEFRAVLYRDTIFYRDLAVGTRTFVR